ncbi:MAG: hypothetical protein R3E32_18415 [Chitinophagales bacterium]
MNALKSAKDVKSFEGEKILILPPITFDVFDGLKKLLEGKRPPLKED